MRASIASLVAVAAMALAAVAAMTLAKPSFAQAELPVDAPAPVPVVKAKSGTVAYCNTLKSSSSKAACLKRVQTAKVTKIRAKNKAKNQSAASTARPDATASTPAAPAPSRPVAIPPLPQKSI